MSTCTIGGVMMLNQEERPPNDNRPAQKDKPPASFRRYVLQEHQRYANEREGPGNQFHGLALHATNSEVMAAWNVPNPSTHFSNAFTRFLEVGIKERKQEKEAPERAYRWMRVEAAVMWLEQQDPEMGEVLRYFQQPAYVRPMSLLDMAGKYGLTVDGLESRCTQAVRRLWWRLGFSF